MNGTFSAARLKNYKGSSTLRVGREADVDSDGVLVAIQDLVEVGLRPRVLRVVLRPRALDEHLWWKTRPFLLDLFNN